MPERLYSADDVAKLWGVDYETVLALAVAGELESVQVGRRRLFAESAIDDFVNRHGTPTIERASNEPHT